MNNQKFKQTEIGLIPDDWDVLSIEKSIEINPFRKLAKNKLAKKISMDKLQSFTKKIQGYEITEFKGGTKFINGDTLLARITPCLENGKTAYVDILSNDEVAFGSTEFLVLNEKANISIKEFVYYLSISPKFRELAISSMTGTSGRQRVQTDFLKSKLISIPPLPEQISIAKILSDLDSKIELLQQQNETLEEIGKTLFKHWFVDFEFPNEEGKPYKSSGGEMIESELGEIPKGWSVGKLGDLIYIQNGYAFKSSDFLLEGKHGIIKIKNISGNIIDIKNTQYTSDNVISKVDKKFKIESGDLLIAMTGAEVAKIGIVETNSESLWLNQRVGLFKEIIEGGKLFSYIFLLDEKKQDFLKSNATGAAQPNISGTQIESLNIILPQARYLQDFSKFYSNSFKRIISNLAQIHTLQKTRDLLLPQLMTGKIRVPLET
jgi:type I restriction enzyme, S subunit